MRTAPEKGSAAQERRNCILINAKERRERAAHQQFGNLDSGFSWFPLVSGLPETWKLGDSAHIELKCENY